MAVKYSVSARKNPMSPESPKKFYGQAQAGGETSIELMAKRISTLCTVTRPDILAVLAALQITVIDALENGEIARLGDLGCLQVSISGYGAVADDDYSAELIKKAKINYRPSKALNSILKTLSFERVSKLPVKEKKQEEMEG